ncbi:MAG: hypothetical protein ACJ79W_23225 [Myxococcales bacterium]
MNAQLPPEGCLSDLALDRMVAEQDGSSAHVHGCERCRSRLELFEAVATSAAVRRVVDRVATRTPAHASFFHRYRFRLRLGIAGACAAAAAIALVAVRPTSPPPPDDVRIKGTSLAFFRQRAGAVTHGVSGESFQPGDALRFVVSSGSPGYFFLVGVLPSGEVVAYHPYGGTKSVPIAGGREITLPGSLVLDESKGIEYFGGLFSPEPLALEEVRTAVRRALERDSALPAQGLDLPATQHWIVIRKP